MTGCCSRKPLSRVNVTGVRAASAWASLVGGLCCLPSSNSYLGFDGCHMESLYLPVGFFL